jgi:hypothetical protein
MNPDLQGKSFGISASHAVLSSMRKGILRSRLPVAAKMALATAGPVSAMAATTLQGRANHPAVSRVGFAGAHKLENWILCYEVGTCA